MDEKIKGEKKKTPQKACGIEEEEEEEEQEEEEEEEKRQE